MSQQEYWLCEGALGAASRPAPGGLQRWRAGDRAGAGGVIAHLNCRLSADAVIYRDAGSANTTPSSKPPHPISVQALINKKYDGRNLKLGRLLADQGAYQRYIITYRGDGLTISGVMNVPDGKGPFPVLVLNHGYIDPDSLLPRPRHGAGAGLSGTAGLRRAAHRLSRSRFV